MPIALGQNAIRLNKAQLAQASRNKKSQESNANKCKAIKHVLVSLLMSTWLEMHLLMLILISLISHWPQMCYCLTDLRHYWIYI